MQLLNQKAPIDFKTRFERGARQHGNKLTQEDKDEMEAEQRIWTEKLE
jgi:hypothetical protein